MKNARLLRLAALVLFASTLVPASAVAQVDFSGTWATRHHEDSVERGVGGELGDYLGLPLNDAGRMRADTWDAALYGLPEWQCRPHTADVMWRSVHPVRIWKDVDPVTGATIAVHANFQDLIERVVYLDGRPHPGPDAPHTWAGFSTGVWQGDTLTVTTTHLKEYILRRDGPPRSDLATMTEHWFRYDDVLTIFQIVTDPVYLTEPLALSTDFQLDSHVRDQPELCEVEEETARGAGSVPHRLPGTMHDVEEFATKYDLPLIAARGGAETMYPDFRKQMRGDAAASALRPAVPAARAATATASRGAVATEIRTTKIRDNLYLLSGAGGNITVLTFPQGVLLVNTGTAAMSDKVLAAVRALSNTPIAHIINTSSDLDDTGGNETLAKSGRRIPENSGAGDGPAIVAREEVLNRMSAPSGKTAARAEQAWPTDTYHQAYKKLSPHFHGDEAIEVFHEPAAHSDGDSLVQFRRSDVIVAGELLSMTSYPSIDLANGGTIKGEIEALNQILDLAFPEYRTEGGTLIVPGHGRLMDSADVGYYRDMVTIIRDRVQALKATGQTLEQVKAAKVTSDYDPRFGSGTGASSPDGFVEAIYASLGGKK